MFSRILSRRDRRRFPRHEATFAVEFELEVYGFEDGSRPFFASGKTVNLSRSGLLARLDLPVAHGSVCKLFFRHTGEQVRPRHVSGRVVRLRESGDDFLLAVEFDEPLAGIEVDQTVDLAAGA
jgi:hypothetical protein